MNAKEINTSFDLVGYVSGIVNLKKSGAYWISQNGCPVCGEGKDRFQIKRTGTGDIWTCRKCHADKYHSVIDFLMSYHQETFTEALKRAGGEVQQPRRELGNGKPVQPPAPVQVVPDLAWQADAWKLIDSASSCLLGKPEGEPGRRYLTARGISRAMMNSQLLGYVPSVSLIAKEDKPAVTIRRPAIVIPWLDLGDVVSAVKFRYIDELAKADKNKRLVFQRGSMAYLYGCRDILEGDKTLLFVEGEINGISIMQTRPAGVSVVSGGSQGNGNAALLQALARHYQKIVIWTDEPDAARTIRERMNRPEARLLKSPYIDSVKYDANEMLARGLLMEFISAELATVCQGAPVDQAIYTRTAVTA
jgi:ribosomal protein L37AE/L43A